MTTPTPAHHAEAAELLPWAPQDDDGLRYRQEQIAQALADAEARGRATGNPLPVLTVLHVRDPDGPCNLTLWTEDGHEYDGDWAEENIDAGAGHDAEEWDRRLAEAEADPPSPYRDELVTVLADPPGAREGIEDWDTYVRPERDDDYTPAAINRDQEN